MENTDFANNFSFEENKYIIFYGNNDDNLFELEFINEFNKKYNLTIIKFLLNNEERNISKNNEIIEIYPDLYTEESLIKDCLCVIYLSKVNRSPNLINLLNIYNKYIIFSVTNIMHDFYLFLKYFNKENTETITVNDISNYSIKKFEDYYKSINNNNYISNFPNKNIKIEYKKMTNPNNDNNNNKIWIITYYKKSEHEILNIVQKKCIIENSKNKYVEKMIVIGKNLNEELEDLLGNIENNNLILHNLITTDNDDVQLSFSHIIDLINKEYQNKLICILRSDIILPNQSELEDLNFELEMNEKTIYCISRIERMISGNLVKYDKLNKILFCTEQDCWIFKSPLHINSELFKNIYFYEKYSELEFNKILKLNDYKLINNTIKFKILRILTENNLERRLLINNRVLDDKIKENIFLLPDNESIDKISFDQLIKAFDIDEKEIYNLKCELFNKYFKHKIISAL